MKTLSMVLVGAAIALGAAACEEEGAAGPEPPFTLTFIGDASFQGAHGGQTVRAALVAPGATEPVVAIAEAEVSATADPSFTLVFQDALESGVSYEVRYWIDSNFGGGAEGVCNPPATDHQWRVTVGVVTEDVEIVEDHRPADTESVCETFTADLSFSGDASFQGAHGGQTISAAVVRASDGAVLLTQESVVSGTDDPSFSFTFANGLLLGEPYELHYWIDSNFGGGTVGECDPPVTDHQWSLDVPLVEDDVELNDTHRPADTESVCATFEP